MIKKLIIGATVATFTIGVGSGVASAGHDKGAWEDCEYREDVVGPDDCAPHGSPVGQNLLNPDFPGRDGLPVEESGGAAVEGITRNPNCPLHWELAP
jgi:hypothetical protein